jgi:hypothetical protein
VAVTATASTIIMRSYHWLSVAAMSNSEELVVLLGDPAEYTVEIFK